MIGSRSRRLTYNLVSKRFQFYHPCARIARCRFSFSFSISFFFLSFFFYWGSLYDLIGLASQIWPSSLKWVPQGLCLAIKEMFKIEGLLEKCIVTENSHFYIIISLTKFSRRNRIHKRKQTNDSNQCKPMTERSESAPDLSIQTIRLALFGAHPEKSF